MSPGNASIELRPGPGPGQAPQSGTLPGIRPATPAGVAHFAADPAPSPGTSPARTKPAFPGREAVPPAKRGKPSTRHPASGLPLTAHPEDAAVHKGAPGEPCVD